LLLIIVGVALGLYSWFAYREGSQGELAFPKENGSVRIVLPTANADVTGTVSFIDESDYYINEEQVSSMMIMCNWSGVVRRGWLFSAPVR
jgi:hypothetical protein